LFSSLLFYAAANNLTVLRQALRLKFDEDPSPRGLPRSVEIIKDQRAVFTGLIRMPVPAFSPAIKAQA